MGQVDLWSVNMIWLDIYFFFIFFIFLEWMLSISIRNMIVDFAFLKTYIP